MFYQILLEIVKNFGFDYAGWRTELPLPITQKRTLALNTAEDDVLQKVEADGYDDSIGVKHCSKPMTPFYYLSNTTDDVFFQTARALGRVL